MYEIIIYVDFLFMLPDQWHPNEICHCFDNCPQLKFLNKAKCKMHSKQQIDDDHFINIIPFEIDETEIMSSLNEIVLGLIVYNR